MNNANQLDPAEYPFQVDYPFQLLHNGEGLNPSIFRSITVTLDPKFNGLCNDSLISVIGKKHNVEAELKGGQLRVSGQNIVEFLRELDIFVMYKRYKCSSYIDVEGRSGDFLEEQKKSVTDILNRYKCQIKQHERNLVLLGKQEDQFNDAVNHLLNLCQRFVEKPRHSSAQNSSSTPLDDQTEQQQRVKGCIPLRDSMIEELKASKIILDDDTCFAFQAVSGVRVVVRHGDLTKQQTEAIVNAANEDLNHGGGVAAAIAREAGPELEKQCREHIQKNGKLKVTRAMHTTAGELMHPIKYVIHTVGPRDKSDRHDNLQDQLCLTFQKCFLYGNETLNIRSLSVPAISSGIFGVDLSLVARTAFEALALYAHYFAKLKPEQKHLRYIYLVHNEQDKTRDIIEVFKRCLRGSSGVTSLEPQNGQDRQHDGTPVVRSRKKPPAVMHNGSVKGEQNEAADPLESSSKKPGTVSRAQDTPLDDTTCVEVDVRRPPASPLRANHETGSEIGVQNRELEKEKKDVASVSSSAQVGEQMGEDGRRRVDEKEISEKSNFYLQMDKTAKAHHKTQVRLSSSS